MATNAENAKRIDELQSSLAQMQKMMEQLLAVQISQSTAAQPKETVREKVAEPEQEWREPDGFKTIRIRSLFDGILTLRYGEKAQVTFNKYGDTQPVMYRDVTQIIINNNRFATEGYFEVMDSQAVHALSLDRYYSNLLTYDEIENIFDFSKEELTAKVSVLTNYQKSLLINRIAKKLSNGVEVDYNKVKIIEDVLQANINDVVAEVNKVKDLTGRR